ncbi:hypothetical protein JVT61DRAFT_12120 [Boletus reticuloceps]|uniref:Polynucleotide 5'-hydroxyl-kinase GRC3 n=1 Tax=Boletus reticuloceps TaxID=495285 RepID=A0A8I2YE57_9AGAM|nr:hypothetical protein JVT61DRAFT_12120 [Boletus reticuloceps]
MSDARHGTIDTDSIDKIELDSESDSSLSQEEMDIPQPVIGLSSVPITKTERAWSPSRPILDSSDDDEPGPSGSFDSTSHLTPSTSKKTEPLTLSTFRQVPNHNVYPISENDDVSSGKARIPVLHPKETLSLVGLYSLCVLQGSVSLLGVTLSPSDTEHTVFAPLSSPIPILSWAMSVHQGSCTFPSPPSIQQQANATAILIEYTDTGVEGLGRICNIFDGVFKLPREAEAGPGIDIPRIHMVCVGMHSERTEELRKKYIGTYRRVAFLEYDLGQSEFTPGGLVALNLVENYVFGPPFTHPSLSYRAHYIRSTSPRASPSHYLHSI